MLHPQLQQFINLIVLLLFGKYMGYIYLSYLEIMGILLFTLLVEQVLLFVRENAYTHISFSSMTTAMGVILMTVTLHYYLYFIIIAFALIQKHFLKIGRDHFFNPSNFALIIGLGLFYDNIHIVLGQLGDDVILNILIILLAGLILYRVKRFLIPLVFIPVYLFMQYLFIVSTDPILIMDDIYFRLYSLSFIVFVAFMLTDPKTTPDSKTSQIVFSLIIAIGATLLDYFIGFRVQHLFMVLFLLTPLFIIFKHSKNIWDNKKDFYLTITVLSLALSVIIFIELKAPYYFKMNG